VTVPLETMHGANCARIAAILGVAGLAERAAREWADIKGTHGSKNRRTPQAGRTCRLCGQAYRGNVDRTGPSGLCRACYYAQPEPACGVAWCTRPRHHGRYCAAHSRRLAKYGDALLARVGRPAVLCREVGVDPETGGMRVVRVEDGPAAASAMPGAWTSPEGEPSQDGRGSAAGCDRAARGATPGGVAATIDAPGRRSER
jgi:hypothetical protein